EDVPFFIRAGKSLAQSAIEIRVQLRKPVRDIYHEHAPSSEYFRFRIGPNTTALAVGLRVKRRGEAMVGRDVELMAWEDQARGMLPYERLLGDAMKGDADLFGREDSIEEQWRIVQPVLDLSTPPLVYEPGSWGPAEADRLVPDGWHNPIETKRAA